MHLCLYKDGIPSREVLCGTGTYYGQLKVNVLFPLLLIQRITSHGKINSIQDRREAVLNPAGSLGGASLEADNLRANRQTSSTSSPKPWVLLFALVKILFSHSWEENLVLFVEFCWNKEDKSFVASVIFFLVPDRCGNGKGTEGNKRYLNMAC